MKPDKAAMMTINNNPIEILIRTLLFCSFCILPGIGVAGEWDVEALLPPLGKWSGRSEQLIVQADDPWITPSEKSGLVSTPRYAETVAWLEKLVAAAPELAMVSIGRSLEGRDIWMIIASADRAFSAEEMRATGKPLLLAQAGIHSGEIDGKDAGMMLLRDMTVSARRKDLLRKSNLLFIPILNVDGHERFSKFNRINQRGPAEMGWRTNARNQNYNRDYTKLDTPGVRAIIEVINEWQPDLYMDIHVTDGVDFQYDLTFGGNGLSGWSPSIGDWIENSYRPAISKTLRDWGHVPGDFVFAVNDMDMRDGVLTWIGDPRYANGYGDARHLPTILVENHSLKPYRRRVLSTYVMLAATMEFLGEQHSSLTLAAKKDKERLSPIVSLGFQEPENTKPPIKEFLGIASERYQGLVSGGTVVRWTGQPVNQKIPSGAVDEPSVRIRRPAAYIVPPVWSDIVERMTAHGITVERLDQPLTATAEIYRLPQAKIAEPTEWTPNPFEGHVRIDPGLPVSEKMTMTFPAGSYRIATNQDLGDLVILMLEPQSPDSFLQWGFFLEIFTRTEYSEAYVMEPLAQKMMAEDPQLAEEFREKLENDKEFAADAKLRLMWFYEKTPFHDRQYLLYPVARIPMIE
jgi:hypothetical protein